MKIDITSKLEKTYGIKPKSKSDKSVKGDSKEQETEKVKKSDSLELSSNLKKIQMIQTRLNEKVYDRNDVIREISKRLIEYSEI